MGPITPKALPTENLRWDRAQRFFRKWFLRSAGATHADRVDDLVQEALIRLIRYLRRARAQNTEALMGTIAYRTWNEFLRRVVRERRLFESIDPNDEVIPDRAPGPGSPGNPISRFRFSVLEVFEAQQSPCHELGRLYFESLSWNRVAEILGKSPEAVRRQWSRCIEMLREMAGKQTDLRLEWIIDDRADHVR
jgi:RNA polymerase sigma factor (sigma-70 family)